MMTETEQNMLSEEIIRGESKNMSCLWKRYGGWTETVPHARDELNNVKTVR